MANSIFPPDQAVMGLRAPMRITFTYDPGGSGAKNIKVLFSSTNTKVTFSPPQNPADLSSLQETDPVTGEASIVATFDSVTEGEAIPISVTSPDGATNYVAATYTSTFVVMGNLVLVPSAVQAAPTTGDLGKVAYTIAATVQPASHGTALKNYPVTVSMGGNVTIYDASGNALQPDDNGYYYFRSGINGEAATFKISSEFPDIYSCKVQYGSDYTLAGGGRLAFLPSPDELGGPQTPFDIWPPGDGPLDLDDFPGAFLPTRLAGGLDSSIDLLTPCVALVNGLKASDIVPYETLAKNILIQKQKFQPDMLNNVSWMGTDETSFELLQSNVVPLSITGDTFLHPPTGGQLPKPFVIGIGLINNALLLKGDPQVHITVQAPLKVNDVITFVYFVNGYEPNKSPPQKIAASHQKVLPKLTAADIGQTLTVKVPAADLSGYAANGTTRGTFECYYYVGTNPLDKAKSSAPLAPIIPLVTA
jgi:hypothetical protein